MAAATSERPKSAEELEREAGPATGAMQDEKEPVEPIAEPQEVTIDGAEQLALLFEGAGGKLPTNARLAIRGSAGIAAGLGFKKGTVIKFTGTCVVDDVGSKDKRDRTTRQVTDCKAKFGALLTDLVVDKVTPPGGEE